MNQSIRFNLHPIIAIIEQIAEEHNIAEKEAEFIVRSQFDWIKEEMGELGATKAIKLKHLGKFKSNAYRVDKYNKRHAKNKGNSTGILEPGNTEARNKEV